MSMNRDELLFYDIEVFQYDSLVVFMDINENEVAHFWNNRERQTADDPSGFEDIPKVIKGKTLVGYNNYNYDDHILTAMMHSARNTSRMLKYLNNTLIETGQCAHKVSDLIHSLDTMQQIDVSHPSLKQIEGNMGMSIVESSVPFDIQRPLTDEERQETLNYCRHDVTATVRVYKLREKSYFETKQGLLDMLPEDTSPNAYRWNTTTLSAMVLLGNDSGPNWDEHRVPKDLWRNVRGIPSEVWDMWEELTKSKEAVVGKGKSKTITAHGCKYVFGMGGLHGAPAKPGRYEKVKHKDVASMYPSSIVRLNALGHSTELYDSMRLERVAIKKTDPVRAGALKLILNSVYGNFKNKYSKLCNPMASATVCIYGQIALFSLCRDLHEAGYKIINANTDGVAYLEDPELNDRDEMISAEWERTFQGYKLDTDYFSEWIQRDVNNYIAVDPEGRVTVKGGDVNKYQTNKYFSNNSVRIVQIALVNKLVYGKDIYVTFDECLDEPVLWQYILKAGGTYKGVQNRDGEWMNKVNRVFACVDAPNITKTKLFKIRQDDGQVNFPDVPELMYLWNGDVGDIENFRGIVDREYYAELINNKLKGWPQDVY